MRKPFFLATLIIALCYALSACTTATKDGAPSRDFDVNKIVKAKPRPLPKSRYGNPSSYQVLGKTYHVLASSKDYVERGIASWYGTKFHGRLTSTREPYDMYAMTAASPVLPIPSFVRVTNLENGKSVVVKVNDRGPFANNRIMDLSYAAAKKLGYTRRGTALVEISSLNIERPNKQHNAPHLYLQVGSYPNLEQAQSVARDIHGSISRATSQIQIAKVQGKIWYRLQLGPMKHTQASDQLYREIQRMGYSDAYTVIR
jgi:rare lipoprotein A